MLAFHISHMPASNWMRPPAAPRTHQLTHSRSAWLLPAALSRVGGLQPLSQFPRSVSLGLAPMTRSNMSLVKDDPLLKIFLSD